ncbi:hypothetical protein MTR_6g034915 [Medicago truncatula]|uniref:RNase H type-1 domain-containing protein n=1 Tax=Medicago truncatula TaxID=3880 RepID=A0A072U831_MEDTR|nr:hypothetical protein MTR_6g034915 [Medicago truncatula]
MRKQKCSAAGKLKCNIDAAFSEDSNRVGFALLEKAKLVREISDGKNEIPHKFLGRKIYVGLCIRDAAGNFRKAKMMWSNPICKPEIGEVLGLLYAIQWVHELQLTNVDFEMDAKLVVDYFTKGNNNVSENFKMEFSWRQANEVAHTLAREALFLPSSQVFNDVPLSILTLINNEKL